MSWRRASCHASERGRRWWGRTNPFVRLPCPGGALPWTVRLASRGDRQRHVLPLRPAPLRRWRVERGPPAPRRLPQPPLRRSPARTPAEPPSCLGPSYACSSRGASLALTVGHGASRDNGQPVPETAPYPATWPADATSAR